MIFIMLAVFAILFLLAHFLTDNSISRKTIYCFLAANLFVVATSVFNFFHLNKVSGYAYFLEMASIVMFAAGFLLYSGLSGKLRSSAPRPAPSGSAVLKDSFTESRVFLILQAVTVLILFYYLARYYYLLTMLGMEKSRLIVYTPGQLYATPLDYYFHALIVDPFTTFCIIKAIYDLSQFRIRTVSFVLTALIILCQLEIGFGRSQIFEMLIYVFVAFFVARHIRKNIKKTAPIFMVLLVLSILICFKLTSVRMKISYLQGVEQLFKQFVIYFDGPLRALDQGMKSFFGVFQYSYGRFTFAGLEQVGYLVLKTLHIDYTPLNYIISAYTQKTIDIGAVRYFNAYYTSIMNYYIDFGVAGVFCVPLVFGAFVGKTADMLHEEKSMVSAVIFAYSFFCMISSMLQWPFQATGTWVTLIGLFAARRIQIARQKRRKSKQDTIEFLPAGKGMKN